jgi:hypothetical protein
VPHGLFESHPSAFRSASLWSFEPDNIRKNETVQFTNDIKGTVSYYRIRHTATDKFLTVNDTVIKVNESEGTETANSLICSLRLDDEENPVMNGDKYRRQLFFLVNVEGNDKFVSRRDVMVQIAHKHVSNGAILYLQETSLLQDNKEKINKKNTDHLFVQLGSEKKSKDALRIMGVDKMDASKIKRFSLYYKIAKRFSERTSGIEDEVIRDERFQNISSQRAGFLAIHDQKQLERMDGKSKGQMEDDEMPDVVQYDKLDELRTQEGIEATHCMLRNLLFILVLGHHNENEDLLDIDGACDKRMQHCAIEQKLIEAVFTMLVCVPNDLLLKCSADLHEHDRHITLKSVHVLTWKVLTNLYKNNHAAEMYFVTQINKNSLILRGPEGRERSGSQASVSDAGDEMDNVEGDEDASDEEIDISFEHLCYSLEILMEKIPYGLGATDAFTTLIHNNKTLLNKCVTKGMLVKFEEIIRASTKTHPPNPEFIDFFKAICFWKDDEPIRKNQELCLEEVMNNDDNDEHLEYDKVAPPDKSFLLHMNVLDEVWPIHAENHINLEDITKLVPSHKGKREFLGQTAAKTGFPQITVSWNKTFYDPKHLHMYPNVISHPKKNIIPIEGLCWLTYIKELVVDKLAITQNMLGSNTTKEAFAKYKEFFDEYVVHVQFSDPDVAESGYSQATIQKFHEFLMEHFNSTLPHGHKIDSIRELKEILEEQEEMMKYFTEQMQFFSEMCCGRSLQVIEYFENNFTFEALLSCMANTHLPYSTRSSFVSFMSHLHLDRFPQEPNCGSHSLPFQVWLKSDIKKEDDAWKSGVLGNNLIKISNSNLNAHIDDILPKFKIPKVSDEVLTKHHAEAEEKSHEEEHHHHNMVTHHIDIFQYNTPAKFVYLVHFANNYLHDVKEYQIYSDDYKAKNKCTVSVLHMVEKLLSFGFYETVDEFSHDISSFANIGW